MSEKILHKKSVGKEALSRCINGIVTLCFCFFLHPVFATGFNTFTDFPSDTTKLKDSTKVFKSLLGHSSGVAANTSSYYGLLTPGEIHPSMQSFAQEHLRTRTKLYGAMKVWGRPYFNLYDHILLQHNLPLQLKYVSVIESNLQSTALSRVGAAGPWQLMPDLAREMGLYVNGRYDERTDYVKSTVAAARYMQSLYKQFNDWLLVIAAYNCGPGGVQRAINKSGSKNFWQLQYALPEETRNHVKKFIAVHYFFEGDSKMGSWGALSTLQTAFSNPDENPLLASLDDNTANINIYGKYNSIVVANKLMMDIADFNQLNPGMDEKLAEGEIYQLRLPSDKVELFQAKKLELLKESVDLLLNNANNVVPASELQKNQ